MALGKTIYLPSVYDPKKVRVGVLEILNLVKNQELKDKEADHDLYSSACEKVG